MKQGAWFLSVMVVAVFGMAACGSGGRAGGECEYDDRPGMCEVVSVTDASASPGGCDIQPVEVRFDYVPDSGTTADLPFPNFSPSDLVLHFRNPPRTCVEGLGLTVGSRHACARGEIASGTCTPVVYRLVGIDFDACACE